MTNKDYMMASVAGKFSTICDIYTSIIDELERHRDREDCESPLWLSVLIKDVRMALKLADRLWEILLVWRRTNGEILVDDECDRKCREKDEERS